MLSCPITKEVAYDLPLKWKHVSAQRLEQEDTVRPRMLLSTDPTGPLFYNTPMLGWRVDMDLLAVIYNVRASIVAHLGIGRSVLFEAPERYLGTKNEQAENRESLYHEMMFDKSMISVLTSLLIFIILKVWNDLNRENLTGPHRGT